MDNEKTRKKANNKMLGQQSIGGLRDVRRDAPKVRGSKRNKNPHKPRETSA